MPCRFPGPHPRGKFTGSGPGPQPRVKLRGIWSRQTAKGEVEGDLARGVCSGGVPALGGVETPHHGYCCGRYASYWNAFLSSIIFGRSCLFS